MIFSRKRPIVQVDIHQDLPVLRFPSIAEWINWLEQNGEITPAGAWIQIAKKNTGATTTTYEEVREGALCFGWIDGLTKRVDEIYYMIKLTPRRPKSVWSKINVGLCEEYIRQGKMRPAGQAQVDLAKQDGRWQKAY